MRPDGLREVYVHAERLGTGDWRLRTAEGPPSTSELEAYLARVNVVLEPGWCAEINLRAVEWLRSAARRMSADSRPFPAPASTKSRWNWGFGIWDLLGFVARDVSGFVGSDWTIASISAIWISSSSPKREPTSTLVKKSPARPDRWAARA